MSRCFFTCLAACLLTGSVAAHPGGVDKKGCHKESRTGLHHCHPERAENAKKIVYDSLHPPKPGDEGVFYGPVVALMDGDTFTAKIQGVVMKFRMQGVDAPEIDQPYGLESTEVLRKVLADKQVVLVFSDVDTYGRIVVQTWVGALDANAEIVRKGAAWFESEYSKDDQLYRLESKARDKKLGLWALPLAKRVEPWIWRKDKKRP